MSINGNFKQDYRKNVDKKEINRVEYNQKNKRGVEYEEKRR